MNKLKLIVILMLAIPYIMQASENDSEEENTKQTSSAPGNNVSIKHRAKLLDTVYSNHIQLVDAGHEKCPYQGKQALTGTTKELLLENKIALFTRAIATISALDNINIMLTTSEKKLLENATHYFDLVVKIQTIELNEAKLNNKTKQKKRPSYLRNIKAIK